ncbi:Bin3-domain-containing protein [Meredithblackwellia eburnea MCA 4105]
MERPQKKQRFDFDSPTLEPSPPKPKTYYQPRETAPSSSNARSTSLSTSAPLESRRDASSGRSTSHVPDRGNYRGYYTKRKESQMDPDVRLAKIPKDWFKGARVLDVGCNSGVVTVEIAQTLEAARVTGVDIDGTLIGQARRYADLAWSRQTPSQAIKEALDESIKDIPPHIIKVPSKKKKPDLFHFPMAMPQMFGSLPAPPRDVLTTYLENEEVETVGTIQRGKRRVMPTEILAFPDNLRFHVANWPQESIHTDRKGYNMILAFSVSKWIHLHGLNAGLFQFFSKCFSSLLPGGRLILEAQPFSSYGKSARFSGELKANWDKLREDGPDKGWKNEDGDFERVLLEEIGFERKESLGSTGKKGFQRPIDVYYKRQGSYL